MWMCVGVWNGDKEEREGEKDRDSRGIAKG